MGLLKFLSDLFAPKFKVGDFVYDANTDFPNKAHLLEIVAVGSSEYQVRNHWRDINLVGSSLSTRDISYVDNNYLNLEDK